MLTPWASSPIRDPAEGVGTPAVDTDIIVCSRSGSYRTDPIDNPRSDEECYHCSRCGADFEVGDVAAYLEQHPPNLHRCSGCDEECVELIERDHRSHSGQPSDEVTDLYRFSRCGRKILVIVKPSAHVLYD